MIEWIRELPSPLLIIVMVCGGTLFWGLVALMIVLWDSVKQSLLYKYATLKRENARLKKYINQLRRENINVR